MTNALSDQPQRMVPEYPNTDVCQNAFKLYTKFLTDLHFLLILNIEMIKHCQHEK